MALHFNKLKVGTKFIVRGKTYKKIKPVKKSCCHTLYNAVNINNAKDKALFNHTTVVKKV